jgi:hypothetical protein
LYGVVEEHLRGERSKGALRGWLEECALLPPEHRVLHVVPQRVLVLYRRRTGPLFVRRWVCVPVCRRGEPLLVGWRVLVLDRRLSDPLTWRVQVRILRRA